MTRFTSFIALAAFLTFGLGRSNRRTRRIWAAPKPTTTARRRMRRRRWAS